MIDELPPPPSGKKGWPWTVETAPSHHDPYVAWPRVTVVTPSFNQGAFLEETIRSVLLQGYPNLEYFVIDGASTDESVEIIEKYSRWITHWVSEPDGGQANAINKGFANATGELLGWLNSDDTYEKAALSTVAQAAIDHPGAIVYVGCCDKVDVDGCVLSTVVPRNLTPEGIADWWVRGFFYQPACFFRREAFETVGGVEESYHNAFDVDLWLKLAKTGRFRALEAGIARAKIHSEMKTLKHLPLRDAETASVAIRHGFPSAATNRMYLFARNYVRNEARARELVGALYRRLVSRFRPTN
jgi:glycosyltransferase involved in cell wall biosynthesis